MITIDDRVGSKELFSLLHTAPAKLGHLDFGDFHFMGRGQDDEPVSIGIERKRLQDFLNSMVSGRLSGFQIPGMINSYNICYLIIEGVWYPGKDTYLKHYRGLDVKVGSRRFTTKEVYGYIHTLQIRRGIRIWKTSSTIDTAQLIHTLYTWWTVKALEDHVSYLAEHTEYADLCTKRKPFVQRVAAELSGIGRKKAQMISDKFPTLWSMFNARLEDWTSIDGIGKVMALKIMEELRK